MSKEIIPVERIAHLICCFRGQKVLLDSDLAALLWRVHRKSEQSGQTQCGSVSRPISCSNSRAEEVAV